MNLLGKPPINAALFALGKSTMVMSWSFLLLQVFGVDWSMVHVPALRGVAAGVLAVGLLIFVLSTIHLGRSNRLGLPTEQTAFKTRGVYAFSRNPMYVSFFLICAASCLFTPHWINVACTICAIVIHHRIVRAEEGFLDERFGQRWREYQARVWRYL